MSRLRSLFIVFASVQAVVFADSSNYTVAVGGEDKERLHIVNEIYNPFTKAFLIESGVSSGDSILEIGCGIGLISQELALVVGAGGHVLATDLNEEQIIVAKTLLKDKMQHLEFRQLSAYELTSLNQQFDVVYIRFLLCHLSDPEGVLRQVKAVLKPGGRLIIEDLTGNDTFYSRPYVKEMHWLNYLDQLQFEIQNSDDHYFDQLPKLLEKVGFSVKQSKRFHPLLDTPRKRKMLLYNMTSLRDSLLKAEKLSVVEYNEMYPAVEKLAEDLSIQIYSYELGQICAVTQ